MVWVAPNFSQLTFQWLVHTLSICSSSNLQLQSNETHFSNLCKWFLFHTDDNRSTCDQKYLMPFVLLWKMVCGHCSLVKGSKLVKHASTALQLHGPPSNGLNVFIILNSSLRLHHEPFSHMPPWCFPEFQGNLLRKFQGLICLQGVRRKNSGWSRDENPCWHV